MGFHASPQRPSMGMDGEVPSGAFHQSQVGGTDGVADRGPVDSALRGGLDVAEAMRVSTSTRATEQHLEQSSERPSARAVYLVFLLFVTTDILLSVDSGALPVALPQLTAQFHLSRFGQGTLGALSPAGFALATTFVGVLLQSRSPRGMLTAGLAITALCSAGFAAAPTPAVLFVTRLGYGVAYAVFFVFAPVWITMFAPEHRATSWISVIQAGAPIGAVVGMDCAGVVAGASLSWRITFILQSIIIAGCMLAFWFVPRRLIDGDVEASARGEVGAQFDPSVRTDPEAPASGVSLERRRPTDVDVHSLVGRSAGRDDHHVHVRRGHVLDLALSPRTGAHYHGHIQSASQAHSHAHTGASSRPTLAVAVSGSRDGSTMRGVRYSPLKSDCHEVDDAERAMSSAHGEGREPSPLRLPEIAVGISEQPDHFTRESGTPGRSSSHASEGGVFRSELSAPSQANLTRVSLLTNSLSPQSPSYWIDDDEDPRLRTRPLYRHMAGPSLALEPDALNAVLMPTLRQQLSLLAANRVFVYASLALGFLTFTVEGIRYWVVLYRTEVFHDDLGTVVAAFTLVSATAPILGMFLGGGMIDSSGGYRTKEGVARSMRILMLFSLCAGPSAAAVLLGDLGVTSSLKLFAVSIWFLLFFGGAHVAPLTGIMIAVVPPEMKSLGSAVSLLVNHVIGFFFAPFGIGVIANARGIKLGFQTVISMSAVAIMFALLGWLAAEQEAKALLSTSSEVHPESQPGSRMLRNRERPDDNEARQVLMQPT